MASHSTCSGAGAGFGVLPLDALYEILLRLSAKELCRLHAVCRPWRSLLSDPLFIAAHATRYPDPLIAVGYHTAHWNDGFICDIMDLSGRVVKQIPAMEGERVKSIQHDLICTAVGKRKNYRLLDLATGAVRVLPGALSDEHATIGRHVFGYKQVVVLGHVASMGEYKVLRVFDNCSSPSRYFCRQQLCEVFTHDGSNHPRWWRAVKAPPSLVKLDRQSRVVVDGTVYFISHKRGFILSFDLGTEDWKQPLRGPLSSHDYANRCSLSMATLNGCLVLVHHRSDSSMDLWFLMDIEKGLWVKKHTIQLDAHDGLRVHPLLVLDDGKIVLIHTGGTLIRTYDPRTNTSVGMAEMGVCFGVGLFTGSLLRLAIGT